MADLDVLVRQLQGQLNGLRVTGGSALAAGGTSVAFPGVAAVRRVATGSYSIQFDVGFFSAAPVVVAMAGGAAGGMGVKQTDGSVPTPVLFQVFTFLTASSALADDSFLFLAVGLA